MGTPVLVVDDDDTIRFTLRDLLTDAGYTVYEAPDGKPALERLADHPDGMVVLLDLQMPGMDGFELVKAIAEQPALTARHLYIVLSAYGRPLPPGFRELLKRLLVPVIPKPFDVDLLLLTVSAAALRLAGRTETAS